MIESVPRGPWQDNAAETRFLDHACARLVSRLQDQRELPLRNQEKSSITREFFPPLPTANVGQFSQTS